jgi:hypothetical protein
VESVARDSGMARPRQEIVRAQLARAGLEATDAVRELREILLGLAAQIDSLDARVSQLEAEQRKA